MLLYSQADYNNVCTVESDDLVATINRSVILSEDDFAGELTSSKKTTRYAVWGPSNI